MVTSYGYVPAAGYRVRRDAPRTRDLRQALRSRKGECKNGNHRTEIDDPIVPVPGYPDLQKCEGCELLLKCNSSGVAGPPWQSSRDREAPDNQPLEYYRCLRETKRIRFYFHGTCCVELDIKAQRVTDHSTYGWSVSTGRAIRWYLEALDDENYIGSRDRVYELIKLFRKHGRGSYFDDAPWYPTS